MRRVCLIVLLGICLSACATALAPTRPAPVRDATVKPRERVQIQPPARVEPRLLPAEPDQPPAHSAVAPKTPPEQPANGGTAATWGQRYYLDDGPGDMPAAEMDRIPDAVPVKEDLHRYANRPYSVFGVTYEPTAPPGAFSQRGMASWYGRRFHGKRTSSGEPYDMYGMSAAHPTLPIPSFARVTNVGNGRSVVVRINDRGPFHPGRIVDLSYAAAHRLGFASRGSAEVMLETIRPQDRPGDPGATPEGAAQPPENVASAGPVRKAGAPPGGLWLQLGAFRERSNAEKMRASVAERLGEPPQQLEVFQHGGVWRVGLGPLGDDEAMRSTRTRLFERTGIRAIPLRP